MENCRLFICFLILFLGNSIASSTYDENDLYLIRNIASKLVLDVTESKVLVQHFDGYTPQLWKFKRASRPGLFYIINNHTGTALDIGEKIGTERLLIVAPENRSLQQQWTINADGHIVNAGLNLNVDVDRSRYVPRHKVVVWEANECPCQKFEVIEKVTCGI